MEIYFTHDNYRKPFIIIISDKNVSIYRNENGYKISNGVVRNIFIGLSCSNETTGFDDD